MLFIFQNGTLLVIHQDAVILANSNIVIAVIVIMLNKYNDNSDSGGDASSPNDCMEESQCVEKKDYSETTYTEEQNSQNERD